MVDLLNVLIMVTRIIVTIILHFGYSLYAKGTLTECLSVVRYNALVAQGHVRFAQGTVHSVKKQFFIACVSTLK